MNESMHSSLVSVEKHLFNCRNECFTPDEDTQNSAGIFEVWCGETSLEQLLAKSDVGVLLDVQPVVVTV